MVTKYGKKCVEMYHDTTSYHNTTSYHDTKYHNTTSYHDTKYDVLKSNNITVIVVVLVNFVQFFLPQRSSFQILFHFRRPEHGGSEDEKGSYVSQ